MYCQLNVTKLNNAGKYVNLFPNYDNMPRSISNPRKFQSVDKVDRDDLYEPYDDRTLILPEVRS